MNQQDLHVIFGTGPLGMAVMEELIARGKRVRMVNRSGKANVPIGVEVIKGDAADFTSVRQVSGGAAVIYHCAAAPYTQWPEKFPPIMEGIIEGAAYSGARLVYGDNLYMYGPVSEPLTEELPYAATGRKGRTRAQMAVTLMEAHKSGKIRAAIGRASSFYGPGVLNSIVGDRVFTAALRGKAAQVLGNPDVPHTFTFIRDFAKGLVTLGERDEALGEVWHIPSAETITTRQFLDLVYKEAGTTPKLAVAPKLGISLLALFNPYMREVKEMLYEYEEPFVMDHGKYARVFGANPTPHREAIRETLNWYRKRLLKPVR